MKYCFFVILFLLVEMRAEAQQPAREKYRNNISLSLFSLVSDNPGLEAGYERRYGKWSTLGTYTWHNKMLVSAKSDSSFIRNFSGYRLALEQRYFIRPGKVANLFLSMYASWMRNVYTTVDQFGGDLHTYRDTFRVHKSVFILSPRFGVQFNFNRITLELSAGLGWKWRRVRHSDREDLADVPPDYRSFRLFDIGPRRWDFVKEESRIRLAAPLNLRVGFNF